MLDYTIDGTPLRNPTRWITSADGAFGLTPERGEDLRIPGAVGETPQSRVRGVAFDEFVMFVHGVDATGAPALNENGAFLSNLRTLHQLLRRADGQTLSVTKTISYADGDVVLGPSAARCVSDLAPRMEAPWAGFVLVRLKVYNGWA